MGLKSDFLLEGRSVILTGAAGLLGRVFAKALINYDATVALVDVDPSIHDVRLAFEELTNRKLLSFEADLRDPDEVRRVVDGVVANFGRVDVLVNNAAGKTDSLDDFLAPFESYSLRTWQEVMSTNVDTAFLMAQAVGKDMLAKGGGSIIQTSSVYGIVAPDPRIYEGSYYNNCPISSPAIYSASKAALNGLTMYLAAYWGDRGIRVNTLTPGGIETGQNETFVEKYSSRVPMQRMGERDDLVGALIFLASDASRYVTGQNLVVDGGLTVW